MKDSVLPESFEELVARLETDPNPSDDDDFERSFFTFRLKIEKRGEALPPELSAELLAFSFRAHDHRSASVWGLYFGPWMDDFPSLTMLTPEVLAYWSRRAGTTPHLLMKARYADLLWELPKKLEGVRPDKNMACVAIDAYLEAVEDQHYEHKFTAVGKGKRALSIALSLRDHARVERARDVLIKLEDCIAEDDKLGLWGFCFDTFVEPPNKHVLLTDAQRDKLIADLETRLARFVAGPPHQYGPTGPQAAAVRLAKYYRRLGRKDDVTRVLRTYGQIVQRMRGTANPLLVGHSLEQLYNLFKKFGLHTDADTLNELLRLVGKEAKADIEVFSGETEIPREKVETYFAAILNGTPSEALLRIAMQYLPRRQEAETQLRELARGSPLSFLLPKTIKDDEGRTIATVGTLESDFEGRLFEHISDELQFSVPWLRESMRRGMESGLFSQEILLDFLLKSPLFQAKRLPMLEAGVAAYVNGDSMAAVHILIPQAEQALRQLAILLEAPIYMQRRGGGLHARTLDDFLHDEALVRILGEDVVTYLRVLLTDARGWYVRHSVCHGLAPVGMLTISVADRVVHALLVLALVRSNEATAPPEGK